MARRSRRQRIRFGFRVVSDLPVRAGGSEPFLPGSRMAEGCLWQFRSRAEPVWSRWLAALRCQRIMVGLPWQG